MKFVICNETFQDWPLEKAFDFAAECGYTGIEIAPFTLAPYATDVTPARRAEICRLAEAAGLEIIGLHWLLAKTEGFCLTSPDPAIRRRTAQYLADLARLSADLGGRILVLGSPQQRTLPPEYTHAQGMDFAADVLQTALPVLEETECVLALEPLTPQETNFMNTAAQAVELAGRIGSPHVRLHLDCKAMASEADSIPNLIRRFHREMVHFHANDPNRQGPGFGTLEFGPIFQALGEVDYRGWVSVEVFDYAPGVECLARASIDYMRNCLAELAAPEA